MTPAQQDFAYLVGLDQISIKAGNGLLDRAKLKSFGGDNSVARNSIDIDDYRRLRKMQTRRDDPNAVRIRELLKQKMEQQKGMRESINRQMQEMMDGGE